ncbi:MAG TPA: FixH family protein [Woeseiaceae bacterium]|nr:FixH family protein [Woeseiaceae bacterium]
MRDTANERVEPWQRNPWVWLVIAIPALTVIGCMLTIFLALNNPDYLVQDSATEKSQPESAAGGSAR